ncbi:MAG TPA: PKD domain-containing protein [Bacteroidia bacterium]|jgi:PKD repeat protein
MKTIKLKNCLLKLAGALVILMSISYSANAQCVASYTYSAAPANNGDIAFTNTSSTGTGLNYYWAFGDGSSSTAANPGTHTYASTGSYTACLTISDSLGMFDSTLGCYNTYCTTISVINSGGTGGCTAFFSPYDSLGYGYFQNLSTGTGITSTWSFGDGTSGTSTGDITHLYSSPGTYLICLTISDFAGSCTDTYCDSLVIPPSSSGACLGIVDATFTATDSMGYGVFSNTPTGSGQVYYWDFGDGTNSSVVGGTTHLYTAPGTYIVCLTVYETGSGTDSCQYCSYVTISSPSICNAYFVIQQDSSNIYSYYVYNYSSSASGTINYFWDFGDGTSSTLAYPSHTYSSTSPVLLCLTITDGAACSSSYCDTIVPGMAMSSPFTVTVLAPTGINEQASVVSTFENYPNPFSEHTTISYSINQDAKVSIVVTDLLGKTITELENSNQTSGSHTAEWNAESVSEGMYLLQLKVNNTVSTKKIIVSR